MTIDRLGFTLREVQPTRRPWVVVVNYRTGHQSIRPANGSEPVADIYCPLDVEEGDINANAKLIAAAPDMLDACKSVRAALNQNATFPADIEACRRAVEFAIAKAVLFDRIRKAER